MFPLTLLTGCIADGSPDSAPSTWCPESAPETLSILELSVGGSQAAHLSNGETTSFILDAWLHPEGALTIEEDECSGAAVPDDGCSIRIRHAGETGADTGTSSFVTAASLLIEHGDDPYWGNGYLAIPVVVKR